jgi:hypothetical protein
LDATLILDLLLSHQGTMGTISPLNGDSTLPNKGYQQDGQPKLYFSNPDLWWAAKYHLPRLGQGGFREALEGLWTAVAGKDVKLGKEIIGKPYARTYQFAEKRLITHRNGIFGDRKEAVNTPLKRVYMVGDNPGMCLAISYTFCTAPTSPRVWKYEMKRFTNSSRIRHSRRELVQKPTRHELAVYSCKDRSSSTGNTGVGTKRHRRRRL